VIQTFRNKDTVTATLVRGLHSEQITINVYKILTNVYEISRLCTSSTISCNNVYESFLEYTSFQEFSYSPFFSRVVPDIILTAKL
jgi:hypothetical protein